MSETKIKISLPEFIGCRIEELNIKNEDCSLKPNEREELQLLELIPSAIKLQKIIIIKREELEYDLKYSNIPSHEELLKISTEFRFLDNLLKDSEK